MKLSNPLCVALDVDLPADALSIARELEGKVGAFKIGPRLTNLDSEIVKKVSFLGPVFVDHKYYDIPSTMEGAARSAFAAGATFVTVHASCGAEALKKMAEVEADLNELRPFKVLAVTVLTSLTPEDLPEFRRDIPVKDQVNQLASQVFACGLEGIVCSPWEVDSIRKLNSRAFVVTPGIRSAKDDMGDQKRTMTAAEAVGVGSNLLVVGRPILNAPDRSRAVKEILESLP
jgi:orotidine-5'-phosphate decarboxylase